MSVLLTRPLAHGMSAGFAQGEDALLRFLDENLLRYDLTTDVALTSSRPPTGPPLGTHRGVVLAGNPRWVTPQLRAKLRRWVRDGGRIWSPGVDALRRTVRMDGGTLRAPSAPQPTDALGARPRQPLVRTSADQPAVITIYEEGTLGLFEGTSGAFAGYESYETLAGVLPGARLDGQAGAEAGIPVIAAWTLGNGFAIHTGLPQLIAKAQAGDPDADALVRRIWTLLARG